jgi:ribosomal protein L11 methylase PrmA
MNNKTEWVEVAISVISSYADAVANFLIEQGSNGIVEEDSKTEKDSVILKAYLKNDGIVHSLLEKTALYLGNLPELKGVEGSAPQIRVNHIPDEDWNKKWKSFF